MDYPWLAHYPEGVAHTINPKVFKSLSDLMDQSLNKFKDSPSFTCMGKTITYGELDEMSKNFGAFLQNDLGLQKGDRIGMQMPNLLQYAIALTAAQRAGLIVVNTNPLYTEREMLHQYNDAGVTTVIILANFASKLEAILPKTSVKNIIVTEIGDLLGFPKKWIVNTVVKHLKKMVPPFNLPTAIGFNEALKKGAQSKFSPPEVGYEDLAFLQYTGGTTGVSKGAMLTHANVLANVEQISEWMKPKLIENQEIMLTPLPLYHIFSLTVNFFAMTKAGMHNILVPNPRDLKSVVKDMKKHQFTVMTGVNTLFNALLNYEEFRQMDFSKFKMAVGGGMAVQTPVAKRWKELTGTGLVEGYGLTETAPVLSTNPVDGREQLGTIGLPVSSTEMKIVDDQGQDVAQGERGEIVARGPQVMKGYWQREAETAEVFLDGGWFRTGDIGIMENTGFFRIVDRKKDMILVSGFNVFPNEIEDVIAEHPKVLEVAVIGVPDHKSTECVKAFIVKKDPSLTEDEIKNFCKQHLTGYKVPRHIAFREELPKTNVGKILRRMLKEEENKASA